ncbi:MAG: MOSC domain-containing protein [Beijerinckiaceae bacterium]|nr:MOSC domain-containing protein [Beijerinckiaceae bacterium]
MRIAALYRHPVKGLSPEPLDEATLETGAHFPEDRILALENGPSGFDPAAAEHLPKMRFLMLMRQERLARLETRFDSASRRLTIRQGGSVVAEGVVDSPEGRAVIERFFETFCAEERRGPVRLLVAPPGFRFMDSRSGFVSILNTATIAEIGMALGRQALDPRRFRGNILLEGLPAFTENDWAGRVLRIGTAELEILKRIDRCAATDVNPRLGRRDTRIVETLERLYGHHDCGVYARIRTGGTLRPGDAAMLVDQP